MADFVILGKPDCPWCEEAKKLIYTEGFTCAEFDVTERDDLRIFIKSLDLHTVPQIFVSGGAYVGGYEDLKAAFESTKEIVND